MVTGAAGFLGSNICRKLVEDNKRVRAFVLPHDKGTMYLPKEVEIVEGNLCDINSLKDFFNVSTDLDIVVIHVASIVTVEPEYNKKVIDVNVGGTKNIVEMCLSQYGRVVVIYA